MLNENKAEIKGDRQFGGTFALRHPTVRRSGRNLTANSVLAGKWPILSVKQGPKSETLGRPERVALSGFSLGVSREKSACDAAGGCAEAAMRVGSGSESGRRWCCFPLFCVAVARPVVCQVVSLVFQVPRECTQEWLIGVN